MEDSKKEKMDKLLLTHRKIDINENDNINIDFQNDSSKEPQEKIIGNYTIEKLIDKGNISKVFLAKHIITGEKVAIKILNKKLFKNNILTLKRIKNQIEILKIVKHENIINLLEIIDNKNKIYLITDYYPNDLLSLIIKNKKLTEEQALNYFSQYINGLHYLHQNGICHRNIRPDNILLDENNEKIKIIDFGLSTTYTKNELLNSPVGDIIYAPPEMHLSEKYSGELSDIWNAGLVLYIMVCGYLPFCDEDEEKNINHIITGFYEIPSNISSFCAEIIKSCLQIDPKKRINFEKLNNFINYTNGIKIGINIIPIDEKIIQECKAYLGNFNNEEIIEKIKDSVKNNKHNEFNALYYLVLKKKKKNGYESVSDLSSDKFKNYIINNINKNDSIFVYKQKKLSNYILKKNSCYSINRSYNNKLNKNSLKIPSYKNQIIYSPMLIKSYNNSKKVSSIGRNDEKIKNLINPNSNDCNISCKNINRTNIKLENIDNNYYNRNSIKCISPKITFNLKNTINLSTKYFFKKKLINSYSSFKTKKIDKDIINRCNTAESNLNDNNTFNRNSAYLINSTILNSMKNFKTQGEKNNSNENLNFYYKPKQNDKIGKSLEIMRKIKERGININKTLYNKNKNYNMKKYYSDKNDYFNNNLDENNDLINILTEDKPLENFNINFNFFNNSIKSDRSNIIFKENNPLNIHKYNEYTYKRNYNKKIDSCFGHKLKVRKSSINRGMSEVIKNVPKIKKFLGTNQLQKDNDNKNDDNNLSHKNSFKLISKNNKNQKYQNGQNDYNLINYSYNQNFIHKKNNSALITNIFDYKNKGIKECLKDKNKEIENGNGYIYEQNKNKKINLENYETGIYDIGVIDLCCLKIENYDKIKQKINKVLKSKKINFNNVKNNKYRCSKLGNIFDIEVLKLENFLFLNNKFKDKINEKDDYFTLTSKRNKQSKKFLYYLSLHIKKNDMKKGVNSIVKEIFY